MKKEIKKKECPPDKPIHNPKTNRCLMECKDGYMRNEEFKCVINKSLIKKIKTIKTIKLKNHLHLHHHLKCLKNQYVLKKYGL